MEIIHKTYSKSRLENAYNQGYKACQKTINRMLNPYGIGTIDLFIKWEKGYDDCLKEIEDAKWSIRSYQLLL